MGIRVKREDFGSHEEFVKALAKELADDVKEISARTGIRPQYVVNKMVSVMCREAERMDRDRRSQSN